MVEMFNQNDNFHNKILVDFMDYGDICEDVMNFLVNYVDVIDVYGDLLGFHACLFLLIGILLIFMVIH